MLDVSVCPSALPWLVFCPVDFSQRWGYWVGIHYWVEWISRSAEPSLCLNHGQLATTSEPTPLRAQLTFARKLVTIDQSMTSFFLLRRPFVPNFIKTGALSLLRDVLLTVFINFPLRPRVLQDDRTNSTQHPLKIVMASGTYTPAVMNLQSIHQAGPPPSYSSVQLALPPPAYTHKSRALSTPCWSVKFLTTACTPTRSRDLEAHLCHNGEHQHYHKKCSIAMVILFFVALGLCILVGYKLGRGAIFADIGIIIICLAIWGFQWWQKDHAN